MYKIRYINRYMHDLSEEETDLEMKGAMGGLYKLTEWITRIAFRTFCGLFVHRLSCLSF